MGRKISRRTILRGLAGGAAVTVGLPLLESMLDDHGTALADGHDIPKRFGVFFWGNGFAPGGWAPSTVGTGYRAEGALAPLAGVRDDLTVVSNTEIHVSGHGHHRGAVGIMTGAPYLELPGGGIVTTPSLPSIDQIVASHIGSATALRSLEIRTTTRFITGEGTTPQAISHNGPNDMNPGESDPAEVFRRLFGGFTGPGEDPVVETDPRVAARLRMRGSVLDAVMGDAADLSARLGESDRMRLEQHLDGIRELELRIEDMAMTDPMMSSPPVSCSVPTDPGSVDDGRTEAERIRYHELMTDLLVMGLACDRTRVFTYQYGSPTDQTNYPWITSGEHHGLSHDEPGDQPNVRRIAEFIMGRFAYMVERMAATPAGTGRLIDQMAVMAVSDVTYGESHTDHDFPILIAGSAGGALRTGLHHRTETDDNASKVVLTLAQAVGAPITEFGAEDGLATTTIPEITV